MFVSWRKVNLSARQYTYEIYRFFHLLRVRIRANREYELRAMRAFVIYSHAANDLFRAVRYFVVTHRKIAARMQYF